MKLHEFHILQLCPRMISQRVAIAGTVPTVAGDLIGLANSTGGQHDRLGLENLESAALAVISESANHPLAILEQRQNAKFHVDINTAMNAMVLERANHFQPGAIPHVRQPCILVSAEIALQDAAIGRAVEHCSPGFQLAHTRGGFLRVQLGHAPVIDILPAAHGIGEMDFPIVPVVHIGQRGGDAAFGHDRVGFAKERLANQAHRDPGSRGLDGGTQPGAAGADDQNVVLDCGIVRHVEGLKR